MIRNQKHIASLMLLLILFTSLSGCLGSEEDGSDSEESEMPDDSDSSPVFSDCMEFAQVERCWFILVPDGLSAEEPVPLVIDLHGYGGSNNLQYNMSGFAEIAAEDKIIVAYPQGYEDFWGIDIGGVSNDVDDVGFLTALIENIISDQPIDENRVYMTGWSNGCMMTQRFAVETQGILAAAGCMAGYLMTDAPASYVSATPFMEVHGMMDTTVNYVDNSGTTVVFFQNTAGVNKGAVQNLEYWADINSCNGAVPEIISTGQNYDIRGYTDCDSDAQVRLMSLHATGHNPYPGGNPTGIQTTSILWDFMSQYSLQ